MQKNKHKISRGVIVIITTIFSMSLSFATQNVDMATSQVITALLSEYAQRHNAIQSTTISMTFAVHNQLAPMSESSIESAAHFMQDAYPTSTTEELKNEVQNQAIRQANSYRRIQVSANPNSWVREVSSACDSIDGISTSVLEHTYLGTSNTTDAVPLAAEILWPNKAIVLHKVDWIKFPAYQQFGTLPPESYAAFLSVYKEGVNILTTTSLTQIGSNTDVKIIFTTYSYQNSQLSTQTLSIAATLDSQGRLVRSYSLMNGTLLSDIHFSEYALDPVLQMQYPDITEVYSSPGNKYTYFRIPSFTWPGEIGFWNQGPVNGLSFIETIYEFWQMGFRVMSMPGASIPAGLIKLLPEGSY